MMRTLLSGTRCASVSRHVAAWHAWCAMCTSGGLWRWPAIAMDSVYDLIFEFEATDVYSEGDWEEQQ